ncbi:hypothetical protein SKAU_G00118030 [Synaphobranchus kaupii]|uniref:Uncharacterized protein n=1 Tax=Synaphobranchus kaupii TaxID=118154 RepID=A0A9Q1IZZ2_SYNKA|nr:hypothetical protein SKAU_G00118030 [Synaphobranchus kaupii]
MSKCDLVPSPEDCTDGVRDLEKSPGLWNLTSNIKNKTGITVSPTYNHCTFGHDASTTVNIVKGGTGPASPSTCPEEGVNRGGQTVRKRVHAGAGDADDGEGNMTKKRRLESGTLGAKEHHTNHEVDSIEPEQDSRQVAPEEDNLIMESARYSSSEQHGSSLTAQNERTPVNPILPACPWKGKLARTRCSPPSSKLARELKYDVPEECPHISDELENKRVVRAKRILEDRCRFRGLTERKNDIHAVDRVPAESGAGQGYDCTSTGTATEDQREKVVALSKLTKEKQEMMVSWYREDLPQPDSIDQEIHRWKVKNQPQTALPSTAK